MWDQFLKQRQRNLNGNVLEFEECVDYASKDQQKRNNKM